MVGHTDKFVKAYRWEPSSPAATTSSSHPGGSTPCSICGSDSSTSTATVSLSINASQKVAETAVADCCTCFNGRTNTASGITAGETGKFVAVYGWRLQFMVQLIISAQSSNMEGKLFRFFHEISQFFT